MNLKTVTRRQFLAASAAALALPAAGRSLADAPKQQAHIAITLDLEMSAQYPRRDMQEWNYRKGDLDDATKKYSVDAARLVKERGGLIHFFCVGRVLEHPSVQWLKDIAAEGHPIGNHTYDHVNVKAQKPEDIQFRFRRTPWLIEGKSPREVIEENVRLTTVALKERAGITTAGFRTPGGFYNGLSDRPDLQQMLLDQGFTWVSAKYPPHKSGKPKEPPTEELYADIVKAQELAQPFVYPKGLIEVPMSPVSDVFGFRTNYWKLDYFLKAVRLGVEWAISTGGVYDLLTHPSCMVVEDPTFETYKMICDLVKQAGDKAAIVDLGTVARRVKKG